MNDKASRYNIGVEHDGGILLYNTLTDALLPINNKLFCFK